jgi:hypothetical protein
MERAILRKRGIDICVDTKGIDAIAYFPGQKSLHELIEQRPGRHPTGQDKNASPDAAQSTSLISRLPGGYHRIKKREKHCHRQGIYQR